MIGYIISEKNGYWFREYDKTLFINDLFMVHVIQASDENNVLSENIHDIIKNNTIRSIIPDKKPIFVFDDVIVKIDGAKNIAFNKILANGAILWVNQDNLLKIDSAKTPVKVLSLNNHYSRK